MEWRRLLQGQTLYQTVPYTDCYGGGLPTSGSMIGTTSFTGATLGSGDNVPTASKPFGNPSYSAVIHSTYVISPTLLNEVAFNYNGNRINILPTGVLGIPSGFNSARIFSGPNNDDRIPEIHLAGYNNTDFTNASWPWRNKADDYQIRDDISWTKGAHQIKMGGR